MPLNFHGVVGAAPEYIKSYDYIDTVARTGYITYYWKFALNTTFFTTDSGVSSSYNVGGGASGSYSTTVIPIYFEQETDTTPTLETTENLDLTFEAPVNLEGEFMINIKADYIGTSSSNMQKCYLKIRPYHYDGSTETALAGQQTDATVYFDDSPTITRTHGYTFTLPLTHFKKGEILRVKVETWISESALITGPKQSLYFYGENSTKFIVPFKIDI